MIGIPVTFFITEIKSLRASCSHVPWCIIESQLQPRALMHHSVLSTQSSIQSIKSNEVTLVSGAAPFFWRPGIRGRTSWWRRCWDHPCQGSPGERCRRWRPGRACPRRPGPGASWCKTSASSSPCCLGRESHIKLLQLSYKLSHAASVVSRTLSCHEASAGPSGTNTGHVFWNEVEICFYWTGQLLPIYPSKDLKRKVILNTWSRQCTYLCVSSGPHSLTYNPRATLVTCRK